MAENELDKHQNRLFKHKRILYILFAAGVMIGVAQVINWRKTPSPKCAYLMMEVGNPHPTPLEISLNGLTYKPSTIEDTIWLLGVVRFSTGVAPHLSVKVQSGEPYVPPDGNVPFEFVARMPREMNIDGHVLEVNTVAGRLGRDLYVDVSTPGLADGSPTYGMRMTPSNSDSFNQFIAAHKIRPRPCGQYSLRLLISFPRSKPPIGLLGLASLQLLSR